jgi:hypothetical protein
MINNNQPAIGHVFTIDHFNLLFNTPAVFAYWFALYPAEEIARRFEFNEKLQQKHIDALWALEQCAKNSGYTVAYYIASVKTSILKLCSARDLSLNSLAAIVKRVESGNFNTYSFTEIKKAVVASDLDHSHQYNLDVVDRWIPDWTHDFYGLIIDHTDEFDETADIIITPDPTIVTPGTTPATTTTATSTASFGKYALPLLGVGLLFALLSKKKK